jgi:hypothetical protein
MARRAYARACLLASAATLIVMSASPAFAEDGARVEAELKKLKSLMDEQSRRLAAQEQALADQKKLIEKQADEIAALKRDDAPVDLTEMRGTGAPPPPVLWAATPVVPAATPSTPAAPAETGAPAQPVGEAPPEKAPAQVAALPEGAGGVLTPKGQWVVEPSFEFVHASTDRLVFRGVEIVPGIQLGVIEASTASRNTLSTAAAVRYGINSRLELEVRVPWVYRNDRVTTLQQRDSTISRTSKLDGSDIGDVEVNGRWQLNSGRGGWPIFVANLGVKSDTGTGPFDIDRDEFGVAEELSTGSGFWAISPSLSLMYPSDPAVLYANLGYTHSFSKDVDKDFGDSEHPFVVGKVEPGDSIVAGVGFGFSMNERFSYSLGYKHSYIFETDTTINGLKQSSTDLQIGSLQMSMSFRLNERTTLSSSFEFGVTEDAPDVRVLIRLPVRF